MAFDVQASQGAVLQMVNHGIVVAAAFVIVGVINRAAPDDRIDDIGGLAAGAPRLAGIFLIVTMASLAIPGSNSFVGRVLHPDRRLPPAPVAGAARLHRHRLRGRLHAAPLPELDERAAQGRPRRRPPSCAPATSCVLLPLVAVMLFIALWPKGIVGATTASIERAIAPGPGRRRPARPTRSAPSCRANPPAYAEPLPGDPGAAEDAAAGAGGGPEATP